MSENKLLDVEREQNVISNPLKLLSLLTVFQAFSDVGMGKHLHYNYDVGLPIMHVLPSSRLKYP